MISQYFIARIMPKSANPVQQPQTIIEIRPFKGGWQCFEGPGVGPYWTGNSAKQSAIDYAKARAKFGHSEIRVLKQDGSVESVVGI
jgi:hypothetical protein